MKHISECGPLCRGLTHMQGTCRQRYSSCLASFSSLHRCWPRSSTVLNMLILRQGNVELKCAESHLHTDQCAGLVDNSTAQTSLHEKAKKGSGC